MNLFEKKGIYKFDWNLDKIVRNKKIRIIKLVLIIFLTACLFNWNYGFYGLVRFLGMFGFSILAFHNFGKKLGL